MIEVSVARNEASYNVDVSPPLLELGSWEFKKGCVRKLAVDFDLEMKDIFLSAERDKINKIHFKKYYLGSNETFEVSISYDYVFTKTENFTSIEDTIKKHVTALNSVLEDIDFSPKFQVVSYYCHSVVESGNIADYIDKIVSFRPPLPGALQGRGAIFIFDGPINDSKVQIMLGESEEIPGGLFLSLQFTFAGKTDTYGKILEMCETYARSEIFPKFEIKFREPSRVE